jgi:signal transduction histidine kinase
METPSLRVLLVEDDEDDYVLVRDLLCETAAQNYELTWVQTYDAGLEMMCSPRHDVCLLDYRLGARDGLNLFQEALAKGCKAPVIFLTGQGDYQVDVEAMHAGAAEYLVKDEISPRLLERSIRYAVERKRAEQTLQESERQLRFLSCRLLAAQEEERKRIAGELHDSIGSCLSAVKFGMENALKQMEEGRATPEPLKALVSLTRRTIDDLRRIMADLRPPMLDDLGFIVTIRWLCREFQEIYGHVRMDIAIGVQEDEIPEQLKMTLFRVLQEALNNIAKYSQTARVELFLGKDAEGLEMVIKDYGVGFDMQSVLAMENHKKGLGLTSMKERVELTDGSFFIQTMLGLGTTIRASWPCNC